MADIPRIRRPGRLRSRAAAVGDYSPEEPVGDYFPKEHGIGEALIERWNGSVWSITA